MTSDLIRRWRGRGPSKRHRCQFLSEIQDRKICERRWQFFAVFTSISTVTRSLIVILASGLNVASRFPLNASAARSSEAARRSRFL